MLSLINVLNVYFYNIGSTLGHTRPVNDAPTIANIAKIYLIYSAIYTMLISIFIIMYSNKRKNFIVYINIFIILGFLQCIYSTI
jgi:lipopolysaccharide export LptBFGC system permease protein LptF